MDGLLLVDKPAGMTSHDVVDRIRKAAQQRRVGHTGTLDPAATGLLLICLGKATRLSEHLTGLSKTYEATLRFGVETSSYDMDGEVVAEKPVPVLTAATIQAACNAYVGTIQQLPPMVSAIKVGGQRLYKLARKGEVVERKARTVTIARFDVLEVTLPEAKVVVECSSGTYIRSLCHDVGKDLDCGAALSALRRTQVGEHLIHQAAILDDLKVPEDIEARLLPMGQVLNFPAVTVNPTGLQIVTHGGSLSVHMLTEACPVENGWVQVKDSAGALLALAQAESTDTGLSLHPKRVFIESCTQE